MTDKQLWDLCQKYGSNARIWARKFAALLPEVNRRGLWKKKFHSIHEFAAQMGGLSPGVVDKVLNLDKKLEEKPKLKEQIAEQGWVKVEVASRIPVGETEAVNMVKALPKKTLETFARGIDSSEECRKPSPGGEWPKLNFTVKPETELRFRKFQQKLEKERKEKVGLGETLEKLLKLAEDPTKRTRKSKPVKKGSRHISAATKRKLSGKCAMCNNPAEEIHHPDRFAVTGNHNRLIPLCHEHHQLAHAGLIANEHDPPDEWRFRTEMLPGSIDRKYLERLTSARDP